MVAAVTPGSLRARRCAVRNLRAAPAMLTPAVIDRLMLSLAMARPIAVDMTVMDIIVASPAVPVRKTQAELESPSSAKRVREKRKAKAPRPRRSRAGQDRKPVAEPTPPPPAAVAPLRVARSVRASALAPAPVAIRPMAGRLDARTPSAMEHGRRSASTPQDASSAVAWLRSHGVSVKAESTSIFGTRWLVSNELGALDTAAVVAIARKKGFGA